MRILSLLIILITILKLSDTSNILAVLPVASKSHHNMFHPIIKELGNRGHNITAILPYRIDTNLTNVNQIFVHTSAEKWLDKIDYEIILDLGRTPLFFPPKMSFWFYGLILCEDYLKSDEIQRLILSKHDKFDLILLETSFGQESLVGFSVKFNAPVISLNSAVNFLFLDEFIGNPLSLSTIPHLESEIASPLSFYNRLWNSIRSFIVLICGYYFYLPQQENLIKKYFHYSDTDNIPPITDLLKNNVSLVISNSHIAIEYPRPLVPNVIGAAGLHINKNHKPIPKDLQEYMDDSVNGFIYFSFGTIIPAHLMPTELKNSFLAAFSKTKLNILWKANVDTMENLPKNVKIAKWFPQQSVLAHPNCKGFITHGGLFSIQEAVYFGVPLIGVPFFADQHMGIGRGARLGYALKLCNKNLTEESILWALNEVVNNSRYGETAKEYSRIFRDNPIDPMDNAIYWIEHVIKYKGARHLRTSKLDLNVFQYLLLDVILFIVILVITAIFFVYFILKLLITKCFSHKKQKHSNKKNN